MEILHLPCVTLREKIARAAKLVALSSQFEEVAERLARLILSERFLPTEQKTLQPINAGGEAGGEKYLAEGVFMKFAIDISGFYGGNEFSQKAAGHELKGLRSYLNFITDTDEQNLNIGLMILVDYKGMIQKKINLLFLANFPPLCFKDTA